MFRNMWQKNTSQITGSYFKEEREKVIGYEQQEI